MKTNTKKKLKASIVTLCALILVFASVVGTLAYLTDYETVTNTFTVGKVDITFKNGDTDFVDEDSVTAGVSLNHHLVPAKKIALAPTVTVVSNSEECYVRVMITVENYDSLRAAVSGVANNKYYDSANNRVQLHLMLENWDAATWCSGDCEISDDGNTATYEFRYNVKVSKVNGDQKLDAVFTSLIVPAELNNTQTQNMGKVTIDFEAHAIQADGFDNAGAAWDAWGSITPEQYVAPANNG